MEKIKKVSGGLLLAYGLVLLLTTAGCDFLYGHKKDDPELAVSLYADGLSTPVGIEVDPLGRLWVAEQGTGQNDSRISIIPRRGEVFPFLTGLPSEGPPEEPTGTWRAYFQPGGDLLLVQGGGPDERSTSLLSVDPAGFTPGDPPLEASDTEVVADLGSFVLGEQGFAESNPYALAFGPNGNQYIVDAAANAIIRRDAQTGALSVFAQFEDIPNPTPVGPPMINAVPTDILYARGRFFVSTLTGFPFPEGAARIYEVDLDGNVSVFQDGLTLLIGLAVDAQDGKLLALQHGTFSLEGGFLPETGKVLKVHGGHVETVVDGLNRPAGMHPRKPGELFISSLTDGEVLRVTFPR